MSATGVGRCLFNKSHKALNTNYYYYRSWRKQIQMKPNINNLKNKTKNIPKIYYIVNTITLQRCIGMRKNNSFILYVIFFPVCWKKAIVINTIGCQWHGHGTEIKGIDTVYLEPVPWLLKGSEDYCFKKWKINLIFKCYECMTFKIQMAYQNHIGEVQKPAYL